MACGWILYKRSGTVLFLQKVLDSLQMVWGWFFTRGMGQFSLHQWCEADSLQEEWDSFLSANGFVAGSLQLCARGVGQFSPYKHKKCWAVLHGISHLLLPVQRTAQVPVGCLSVYWNWTLTPDASLFSLMMSPNLSLLMQPKYVVTLGFCRIHWNHTQIIII